MAGTVIRPKTREEWLECRKSGIGSSEIGTLLGLNPYETPYQLWRRKTGLDGSKEETFAMKAGHYLEDAVSRFWEDETGRKVIKSSAGDWLIRDSGRPYLQVSPDRTYWLPDAPRGGRNKGILECKTTQREIDPDDLPKTWFCQVQMQLGVAGYPQGSLAWLSSGRTFGYRDIHLVPDFFEWMASEAEKFWKECIEGGKEPEAVSARDVMLKYCRQTDGKTVEVGDDIAEACSELQAVKDEMSALEERKKELEDKVKMAFGDAEAVCYGGRTLATWKAPKPALKLDTGTLYAEHPELKGLYMVQQQGARRLLLR